MARVAAQGTTSIAANASNKNVMSGETYERIPYDADLLRRLGRERDGLLVSFLIGGIGIGVNLTRRSSPRATIPPGLTRSAAGRG